MKPDCYECTNRRDLGGNCHSACFLGVQAMKGQAKIKVTGNPHGIKNGWFFFPLNYDPIWLESCDSFERKYHNEVL